MVNNTYKGGVDGLFNTANDGVGYGKVSEQATNPGELIATLEEWTKKLTDGKSSRRAPFRAERRPCPPLPRRGSGTDAGGGVGGRREERHDDAAWEGSQAVEGFDVLERVDDGGVELDATQGPDLGERLFRAATPPCTGARG